MEGEVVLAGFYLKVKVENCIINTRFSEFPPSLHSTFTLFTSQVVLSSGLQVASKINKELPMVVSKGNLQSRRNGSKQGAKQPLLLVSYS